MKWEITAVNYYDDAVTQWGHEHDMEHGTSWRDRKMLVGYVNDMLLPLGWEPFSVADNALWLRRKAKPALAP